jgi:hypothetical protein
MRLRRVLAISLAGLLLAFGGVACGNAGEGVGEEGVEEEDDD